MKSKLLTFRTLTPLHVGSGTSVSYIDLPIARERHTDFPVIPGSGIKGVIRDVATRKEKDVKGKNPCSVENVFGPEPGKDKHRSALAAFTDAKILFYPVRSLRGVFALITSPYVLRRFAEDMRAAGIIMEKIYVSEPADDSTASVSQDSVLLLNGGSGNDRVVLEEFNFSASRGNFNDIFGVF